MLNGDALLEFGEIPEDVPGTSAAPNWSRSTRPTPRTFDVAHARHAKTVTHGLNDSPVGLLAGFLPRWRQWSDSKKAASRTSSTVTSSHHRHQYWVTESIGSSIRSPAKRQPLALAALPRTTAPRSRTDRVQVPGSATPTRRRHRRHRVRSSRTPTRRLVQPVYVKAQPRRDFATTVGENAEGIIDDRPRHFASCERTEPRAAAHPWPPPAPAAGMRQTGISSSA